MSDALGAAISDYHDGYTKAKLWIHNTYGPKEEMPVEIYFRDEEDMPELELKALQLCKGKVLDIGAGAGSHALWLQTNGFDVTALEISSLACEVIRDRGVKNVVESDIFKYKQKGYDTILLMMNGIGLSQTVDGLHQFLLHVEKLLNPKGQLIFDSSDIAYLYEGFLPEQEKYYGEITYRYAYKQELTDWFSWLYIDRDLLATVANKLGWHCEVIDEDDHHQFLVRLTRQ